MMPSIIFTIFLEGDRDSILFNHKIKREIESDYDIDVELVEYSQKDKKFVNTYIDTINRTPKTKKYILLADIDKKATIKQKNRELLSVFDRLDETRIVIVCKEIEGWYLGGISRDSACVLQLDLNKFKNLDPNAVTKAQFQKLKPNHIKKLRFFYITTAKMFDKNEASQRNTSFNTFTSVLTST